jgi:hypothetical protein
VILAVQCLLIENPDALRVLQRLPDLPEADWDPEFPEVWPLSIVELLLAIGVYSDRGALVSSLAFRLVGLIAYGYGAFPNFAEAAAEEPVESEPRFGHPTYTRLVHLYAKDIIFSFPPTNQMLAAFPIFWNCPYDEFMLRDVGPERSPELEFDLLDIDGNSTGEKWTAPRATTLTPLEVLGHYILYDPAPLDSFNNAVLGILMWYNNYCHHLRVRECQDTPQYVELQKQIYDADLVIFRFLERKFKWSGQSRTMQALWDAFPLDPTHGHYIEKEKQKRRAVMNGVIVEFLEFLVRGEFFFEPFATTYMVDCTAKIAGKFESEEPYHSARDAYMAVCQPDRLKLGGRSDKPPEWKTLTDAAELPPPMQSALSRSIPPRNLRTLHK